MAAVGKKLRMKMSKLDLCIEMSQSHGLASVFRNSKETRRRLSCAAEDDRVIATPGRRAVHVTDVADCLRNSAGEFDLLQFALRDEADIAAVRRPEWCAAAGRLRDLPAGQRIERANPDARF